ncbi:MAG: hypothetical protein KAR35_07185 [Candidatus Heimdallarchaeota archaeon]|nr:hypothetical protein [Candidatus Heimdallarchaeota archaeon]MCK5049143.1 hypothetical protein [Candidatus Heimdallarchaeota archaeon]
MSRNNLEQEILDLHKETIDAHLKKDVDFFVKNIAKDYFSVSRGELRRPTKEEITTMFTDYLGNTEFSEYRDLNDPIIKVSDDGSLGWSIVTVKIVGVREIDGEKHKFENIWTWITLYERENDIWMRMGEVSSMKPL